MKKLDQMMEKTWFTNALTGCIVVAFYVIFSGLKGVFGGIGTFIGYFSTILAGVMIAYIMNTLAKFYQRTIFKKIKKEKVQWGISVCLTVLTGLIFLLLLIGMLIPQLIGGVTQFITNLNDYADSFQSWIETLGNGDTVKLSLDTTFLTDASETMVNKVVEYVGLNSSKILNTSAIVGKAIMNFF
ncbi:MAG: AI-2E family transporter, partial [Lachnospiraceae bacterium]|nr:AI-2E family transporter [Lachnospiraceae bacterium]